MKKIFIIFSLISLLCYQSVSSINNEKALIESTDYVQIILYGQSLGMGWESPRAITTDPLDGNYMIGNNVLMKYNNNTTVLTPLVATVWAGGGEQPIVACVNSFSKMYKENVNPDQKFIAMTGGEGGQTIEKLSKECTNSGFYASTFIKILDNTLLTLNKTGKTVSCPAIIYMQGEYNCNDVNWYGGRGITPGSDGTIDKDTYKALLLQLKNNMQTDIMQKYGQKVKPLFFIYQTSGGFIKEKEMFITMGQLEFSNENDDVYLLNPQNALPHYGGGHLSTNGYRWYGELMSKTLYNVLVSKNTFGPIYPENFSFSGQTMAIDYHVPVPPLVLDTLTNSKAANYGFKVYKNNYTLPISKVEITGNRIILTFSQSVTGKIEVIYAGVPTRGTGNVCDSNVSTSMYTYFDDSADSHQESYTPRNKNGSKIYGQPYPMQNWSVSYYKSFNVSTTSIIDVQKVTDNYLVVFKNSNNQIVVNCNKLNDQKGMISVYNMAGQKLLNMLSTGTSTLVSNILSPGFYFVMVTARNYCEYRSIFI